MLRKYGGQALYRRRISISHIVICALLIFFALVCILPMMHIFALAFNDSLDSRRGGFILFPRKPSIQNFREIFNKYPILRAYGITLFRTVCGILLEVMCNAMYAFALTKRDLIQDELGNEIELD